MDSRDRIDPLRTLVRGIVAWISQTPRTLVSLWDKSRSHGSVTWIAYPRGNAERGPRRCDVSRSPYINGPFRFSRIAVASLHRLFVFNSGQPSHNESFPSRPSDLRLCALRLCIDSGGAGDDAPRPGEQSVAGIHALHLFISGAAGANIFDI